MRVPKADRTSSRPMAETRAGQRGSNTANSAHIATPTTIHRSPALKRSPMSTAPSARVMMATTPPKDNAIPAIWRREMRSRSSR